MRQALAEVKAVEQVGPFARVQFAAPGFAHALTPGRAILAAWPDTYLRRTCWPCAIDAGSFAILLNQGEAARYRAGDRIDILGPAGRGFRLDRHARNILLVASGASGDPDIGPLLALLDQALAERRSVTLAYAAPSLDAAYPVSELPPAIEVIRAIAADPIALLPDAVVWADQVLACGPIDFAARLAERIDAIRIRAPRDFAQALGMTPLPCGVGACGLCAKGPRLACVDGPVFELNVG
ncbi:MAG TPA: hypothetical protein VJ754_10200 [Anaerolineae bacterium]|nr:hypothetical protein [Anaerolineae bacterium]